MPNRLANTSSPYLRQHADNPVDWYPWGEDAFALAKAEHKPILLSVGYASCHWCHVMAHESFEDDDTAQIMNREFVNIKVDREERPDVDAVYMEALQMMTGSGGWPMTIVMTPAGKPFFAGTYFPKEDRPQYPAFQRVLLGLADAWHNRPDEVTKVSENITDNLGNVMRLDRQGSLEPHQFQDALHTLKNTFDNQHGGFGSAPKFPPHSILRVLLQETDAEMLEMATLTLDKMAAGGIYDHLGGGFARYSVDAIWLVPHFEKMLYDNAQLVPCYLEGFLRTGNMTYRDVAQETLEWVTREMTDPDTGGFYSALDADSEGEEGKFYVWTAREFDHILGEDARFAKAYYGVGEVGNFEGKTVLQRPREDIDVAHTLGISEDEVRQKREVVREKLFAVREQRVRPGLDDKILTSLNGLMLAAFADAGRILGEDAYLEMAIRNATFLRDTMMRRHGDSLRLWHVFDPHSGTASIEGMLEDYTYLGLGLLALYRATFERQWLELAFELAESVLEHFHDPKQDPEPANAQPEHPQQASKGSTGKGGFFTTADDAEALIVRPKSYFDAAMPSGNGAAAMLLWQVAHFKHDADLERIVQDCLAPVSGLLSEHPHGFGTLLSVLRDIHATSKEIILVAPDTTHPTYHAMLAHLNRQLIVNGIVLQSTGADDPLAAQIPALSERGTIDGMPTAYVCENFTCQLPVTDASKLAEQLEP